MPLNGGHSEKNHQIKQQQGPARFESANLDQTLVKHNLVDALWLKLFPITLGVENDSADGTIPAALEVTESTVTSKGLIIVNYERTGERFKKALRCSL